MHKFDLAHTVSKNFQRTTYKTYMEFMSYKKIAMPLKRVSSPFDTSTYLFYENSSKK